MSPKAKSVADKLLANGAKIALVGAPAGQRSLFDPAEIASDAKKAGLVLVYAPDRAALEKQLGGAVKALSGEARLWIAYPKAGKLDTDLNRDTLWPLLEQKGFEGVRLVSVDDTWSAMMFRRAAKA
jgi:hypothetical protein